MMTFIHTMQEMWRDGWATRAMLLFCLIIIGLLPVAIRGIIQEQKEWEDFAVERNCKVTDKVQSSVVITTAPIVNGSGGVAVGTSVVPGKTAYLCDDGVTYWR